ncbi:MAG: hypothetical protein Q4G16_08600 [Cruoricaptor ignavus]|nr:hypothetical protein [Cruoricaptor ignavus]
MIKKILNHQLDFQKYQRCISQSVQRNIYSSQKLMHLANGTQWDFLVYGDYEAVMPVPFVYKMGIKIVTKPWTIQQLGVFSKKDNPQLNAEFREFLLKEYIVHFYSFNEGNQFLDYNQKFQNYSIKKNNYETVKAEFSINRRRNIRIKQNLDVSFEVINDIDEVKDFFFTYLKLETTHRNKIIYYNILKQCFLNDILKVYQLKINNEIASIAMILQSEETNCTTVLINAPKFLKENSSSILINLILQENIETRNLSFSGSNIPAIAEFYERFGAEKKIYNILGFSKKQVLQQIVEKKLRLSFGRKSTIFPNSHK